MRAAISDLALDVEERDVGTVATHAHELREQRGRGTVPVLRVDTADGSEWIGESADIVRRLYADYGAGRAPTFLASSIPQRLGWLAGGCLSVGAFIVPPALGHWLLLGAAGAWLLGTRAPLLQRYFRRQR